jgi:hypothetical protein
LARQENQTPVAIADIAKAKIFRLNFRKYPLTAACWFWVLKKEKGEAIT